MSDFWNTAQVDECEMCGVEETDKKEIKECSHCNDMYCPSHLPTKEHSCYAVEQ